MRLLSAMALLSLADWCVGQAGLRSPCPDVLRYEPPGDETDRWYAIISISTDSTIYSLWLNIMLDGKAELFGNWAGDVTSTDNTEFKIENTLMRIQPGPATAIRFFVKYNPQMKIPTVTQIRLNGREICNVSTPAVNRPDLDSQVSSRFEGTSQENRPVSWFNNGEWHEADATFINRPSGPRYTHQQNPETFTATKPFGPVYIPTQNPPIDQVAPGLYSINPDKGNWLAFFVKPMSILPNSQLVSSQPPVMSDPQPVLASPQARVSNPWQVVSNTKPVISNTWPMVSNSRPAVSNPQSRETNSRPVQPDPQTNSAFATIPADADQGVETLCGRVIPNANPLVLNGKTTLEGQWPWHVALYQFQRVDSMYICGGTLVSRRHVVTAAHCVTGKSSQRIVDKNTLSVYFGKHNLRTSTKGVQILFVNDIIVYPQYNASTFSQDISILDLAEPVRITDFVRPACLWPEQIADLSYVVGYVGTVVGWGFDVTGMASEELLRVDMPVVDRQTCIMSNSLFFGRYTSETTYCAGYRDGTSVCNGDSGGGMVMNMGGTWYLRGLVSLSISNPTDGCDPSHYVIFTDIAKYLWWIKEIIRSKN